MKIDTAIEIITLEDNATLPPRHYDLWDAIRLGKEALKRCKQEKEGTFKDCWNPLPGETEA